MAYPVGPPRGTDADDQKGDTECAQPAEVDGLDRARSITNTSTKVPMASVVRFQPYERMAGPVENTPSLVAA